MMDFLSARKQQSQRRKPLRTFFILASFGTFFVLGAVATSHVLDMKERVLFEGRQTQQAFFAAENSLANGEFAEAEKEFRAAQRHLASARAHVGPFGNAILARLEELPFSSFLRSGSALLDAGEHLARAGEALARGGAMLSSVSPEQFVGTENPEDAVEQLSQAAVYFAASKEGVARAHSALSRVDPEHLPQAFQEDFLRLRDRVGSLNHTLSALRHFGDVQERILGAEGPRKYLLLFQNSSELRATGGFIGSYGLLELFQGKAAKFTVDDIYNIDWQIRENIIPPKPLQEISTGWSTHDANWFLDFPTSAEKISDMYEKTGGATPDGVIAFTPAVLERLLAIAGPVTPDGYDITVTSENFVDVTQEEVEFNYDRLLNRPKKFLVDLVPALFERIQELSSQDRIALARVFLKSLEEKDILIFLRDGEEQQLVLQNGWGGEIRATDNDFLAVVHSNINGFKTDRVVADTIAHEARIRLDGSVTDTVTVERIHAGGPHTLSFYNKVNKDYLRIYVPAGAELLSASGFTTLPDTRPVFDYTQGNFHADPLVQEIENGLVHDEEAGIDIFQESGKTVFGGWVFVSPGESVVVSVSYNLPEIIDLGDKSVDYSLFVQKQPGSRAVFSHSTTLLGGWERVWMYPEESSEMPRTFSRDLFFASVWKQ